VAYKIRLPSQLAAIHNVFHVSQLKKCIKVPTEIIETTAIEIEPDLTYVEQPIQILDTKERVTRRKTVKMYKILWDHHTEEEATWKQNPIFNKISQTSFKPIPKSNHLILSAFESRDEILFRGEGCDNPVISFMDIRPSVKSMCLLWC
jgi:hypothetical protein